MYMKRLILSLICIFISISVTAETVYKTTNPDGSVTFTDQRSTDSEEVKIRKPTTYAPIRLPSIEAPKEEIKLINYEVTIIEPSNDATIIGDSKIKVSISVSPDLPESYMFRYQLGSQSLDSLSTDVSLDNIVRGTHVLRVSIINVEGEVVNAGSSTTFHMKRHFKKAIVAPKKPKAP